LYNLRLHIGFIEEKLAKLANPPVRDSQESRASQ
jgi:hypothetical protein